MRVYAMTELEVGNLVGLITLAGGVIGALLAAWIIELLRRRNQKGTLAMGVAAVLVGVAGAMALMPTGFAGGALILLSLGTGATTGPSAVALISESLSGEQALAQAMAITGIAGGILALVFFGVLSVLSRGPRGAVPVDARVSQAGVNA